MAPASGLLRSVSLPRLLLSWEATVAPGLTFLPQIPLGFTSVELRLAFSVLTLCGAVFNILWYLSCICSPGAVAKSRATIGGTSLVSPLPPIVCVVAAAIVIYLKSPSNLYESHPCLYLLTFGVASAKVTNKLVVAHMTKNEIATLDSILIAPSVLILNQYFNTVLSEILVLWLAFAWSVLDLTIYAVKVCLEISTHLEISVFRIDPRLSAPRLSPDDCVNIEIESLLGDNQVDAGCGDTEAAG